MSADNWGVCPRCKVKRDEHLRSLDIDLAEAYGTVTVDEFDRMRADRDQATQTEPQCTLREDYEIWTDEDGRFYASYQAGCRECGFGHTILQDIQLEVGHG